MSVRALRQIKPERADNDMLLAPSRCTPGYTEADSLCALGTAAMLASQDECQSEVGPLVQHTCLIWFHMCPTGKHY